MERAVVVFTRDLRVRDNPALVAASASARLVVPLFVFDRTIRAGATREAFLVASLADLDRSLRDRGAALVVRRGDWVREVLAVAKGHGAGAVHVARDVSGYAQRRLGRLRDAAAREGVEVHVHDSVTVVAPGATGKTYRVFTPYHRRWLASTWRRPLPAPRRLASPREVTDGDSLSLLRRAGRARDVATRWAGGERAGVEQVRRWVARGAGRYGERRDDLAADATSHLSPWLHFGCVSPLALATRLRDEPDAAPFVRQLCWRDFFAQLLFDRPELARVDLRPGVPRWRDDPSDLAAWKAGRTGYPLVDAAMRQLAAEGWMPNRARMVVASFLTKDLMVDWRAGAAHFMSLLVDGDVATNQLSWQWVAGTGTGANPLRVLNPSTQLDRFDPERAYVRRWLSAADLARTPIVDHDEAVHAWAAAWKR